MIRWFADNSELMGVWGAEIPDILLFGGVAVSESEERRITQAIEDLKRRYRDPPDFPLKWNFRDLETEFNRRELGELYTELISKSNEWRRKIFEILAGAEIAIITSCLFAYSNKRKVLKEGKEELSGFVFSNGLMRFGLHIQENAGPAEVVLDWPDRNRSRPFDDEYSSAYYLGKTAWENIDYYCGELHKLGFHDTPRYSNMAFSVMLQVADCVVGATRELVEVAFDKRAPGFGIQLIKIVLSKFRGAPDNIIGRGLSVAPNNNKELKDKLEKKIQELQIGPDIVT